MFMKHANTLLAWSDAWRTWIRVSLECNQNSQVPQVVSSRPSLNFIAERGEERIRIEVLQCFARIQASCLRAHERAAIRNRARCGTVTVNSVRPRAEYRYLLSCDSVRAGQGKLLIPPASSPIHNLHRNLSAGKKAHAPELLPELRELFQQILGGALVIPVVARVVHARHKTSLLRGKPRRLYHTLIGENWPPARARESRLVRLRRF